MRVTIDTTERTLTIEDETENRKIDLYTREAFEVLSRQWLRVGWDLKYSYTFTWLGRPIVQLPEDLLRLQEVISRVTPDVIIETGVAHGGSLVFYASLFKLLGRGRVIGVDIEIRPENRRSLEGHFLSPLITLIEGDSIASDTVRRVMELVTPGERVMVLLDSCHTKEHVLAELEAYHDLVSPGSYIVATDGIMRELSDVPSGKPQWAWDHPCAAVAGFLARHSEFALEQPAFSFNESRLQRTVSYWPDAWLRRVDHAADSPI